MAILQQVWDGLRRAYDAYEEILDRFVRYQSGAQASLDAVVHSIRSLPADDGAKKRELQAFFDTDQGQIYGRTERFKAFNDLLGVERNRERQG